MKILIIDDDIIEHELNSRLLEIADNNSTIVSSFNGKQGVDYIEDHLKESEVPDVILLDMQMPVMDGWGFLEEFKNLSFNNGRTPSVYILSSQNYDRERAMTFPVMGVYSKPLTFNVIGQIFQDYHKK